MRKTIFITITIILLFAMIFPLLNLSQIGNNNKEFGESPNVGDEQNRNAFSLPLDQIIPERCLIDSPYKEDWQTITCETFDGKTGLWTGEEAGLKVEIADEKYVFNSSIGNTQLESVGYSFPVLVGAAQNLMLSVSGEMDCLGGNCAWGVFVRSTMESIVYVFLVHDDGSYSLTGLSPQESDQNLGNIQAAANSIINKTGENTIVAITEGPQMMFFVNGVLLATHEAYDASNPSYGIMAWGSPGTKGFTRLDNLLAKSGNN